MSKPQPFSVDIELGGFTFRIEGTGTEGDPGRTSGPLELCYEGHDAEIEIAKIALVTMLDGKEHVIGTFEDVFADLNVDLAEVIEPLVWEQLNNQEDDDYDPSLD